MFRPSKTPPPEDTFSEFPAEHDLLLWPEARHHRKPSDAFNEFAPEDDTELDRWLAVARSQQPTLATVPDYRHPVAVAAVVVSLLTPAAIIGMFVVDSGVTAVHDAVLTAAPLPASLLEASIARPAELPPSFLIPAPPVQPPESKAASVPAPARPVTTIPKPTPTAAFVSPSGLLPFTNAVLSSSTTSPPAAGSSAATPLAESPRAPASPPPAPAAPPPTPAGVPAMRVVSPPSSATIPPAPEAVPESVAVRTALDRYRRGFNELDTSEVKAIWPDVDQKNLSRAFSQLSRQLFVFDTCKVDVKGVLATASCRGRAQYVPKVGNKNPRVELREWTFLLQKGPDDWWIRTVDSK